MQRVRIGLTGLAFVFLLVLAAAIIFGTPGREAPSPPEEPLAELGVAPGGAGAGASPVAPPHDRTAAPHPVNHHDQARRPGG